ncbi:MAG: thioesterase [Bacilli bacterium]|jgi:acyl-ACP thioesterase|nr:thioesterase [Bacilli bacterium]MCH4236026.1 thioesterase [Bacilli bacterium]
MKLFYSTTYKLTTNFFDAYDRLTAEGILDLCQDIAGRHATMLGLGFAPLNERHLHWVVLRNRFVVKSDITNLDEVIVETWPLPAGRADFLRCYRLRRPDGTLLIEAISQWVIIDSRNNMIQRGSCVSYGEDKEFYDNVVLDGKINKLDDFALSDKGEVYTYAVEYGDIDHNLHMNNTKYCLAISNFLKPSPDVILKEYQIDYLHETRYQGKLSFFKSVGEEVALVEGYHDGKISTRAEIHYQKVK